MLNTEKLKQLNRKFIQLKLASYNANEYIYNYFSDLRNEVDLAANGELAANEEENNQNNDRDNEVLLAEAKVSQSSQKYM